MQEELITNAGHYQSLFAWTDVSAMLKVQYRMHPDIARFPNKMFYQNQLEDAPLVKDRPPPWQYGFTYMNDVQKAYIVWDTSKVAEKNSAYRDVKPGDTTSRYNLGEIDAVVALLEKLNNAVKPKGEKYSVIVLSPYKRQVCG